MHTVSRTYSYEQNMHWQKVLAAEVTGDPAYPYTMLKYIYTDLFFVVLVNHSSILVHILYHCRFFRGPVGDPPPRAGRPTGWVVRCVYSYARMHYALRLMSFDGWSVGSNFAEPENLGLFAFVWS